MSDFLSSLKKDFRDYAFEGKKSSSLAKALEDNNLTADEYKSLKKECVGDKTGQEAIKAETEFNAAMTSVFGSSVEHLQNNATAPAYICINALDDDTVSIDNNNSLTDGVK